MKRQVIISDDGSHTIEMPESGMTYHSRRGAIQESLHVFIEAGLNPVRSHSKGTNMLRVFEMGFGTGLNAFLTAIHSFESKTAIHYSSVETSPLSVEEASHLNYPETLGHKELYLQLHQCKWNEDVAVHACFTIQKIKADLLHFSSDQHFDLIYYDAFAPSAQPELWTKEIFDKLYSMLQPGGVLVTYCAKGDVRRAMLAAGFSVEKLPGPKGKREMLRAHKL